MTLFAYGGRLAPVREGRYADAATALAWLVGGVATVAHPAGLAIAGLLLGLVAPSIARAFASAASFGVVVAAAVGTWFLVAGAWPPVALVGPELLVVLALLAPPAVAVPVRALG